MQLTMDSLVRRADGVVAAPIRDELVLMSVEQGQYYGTSGPGAWLWEQIEHPRRISDLCEDLRRRYEVDAATCRRDVLRFLEDLQQQGMVTVAD